MGDNPINQDQLELLYKNFSDFAEAMKPVVIEIGKAVTECAKKITDAVYQAYLYKDAPYGENWEGCAKWLLELYEESKAGPPHTE